MTTLSVTCPHCNQHEITGNFPPNSECRVSCINNENAIVIISVDADGNIKIDHRVNQPASSECYIATAAYGSPIASEVQLLRDIRDNVLRQTRWGRDFFDTFWQHYYQISPGIAERMRNNPELLKAIRWSIVTPWVNYMKLLASRPDFGEIDYERLEPGIRSFLRLLQRDMSSWVEEIELPKNFGGYTSLEAVHELNVVLDFLRHSASSSYLSELVQSGALPIEYEPQDEASLQDILRRAGRTEGEIGSILYKQP
jgi:hypothetical protein